MARIEVPKLRRMLENGQPAVLLLIRVQGMNNPTMNHQVLATGYEFDRETKEMKIFLYDPNHPGEQPSICLDLKKPSAGLKLIQSTGEALRGFFVVPYKSQESFPRVTPAGGISFAAPVVGDTFRLQWPVDSRRVNQKFGENPQNYNAFSLPGHEGLDLYAPTGSNNP